MSRAEKMTIAKSIRRGESLGQFMQRIKNGGTRKPLRSLRELADEFGIEHRTLQGMLVRTIGAPKPVFSTGGHRTSASQHNTWYDPDEVRKWYKSRTD